MNSRSATSWPTTSLRKPVSSNNSRRPTSTKLSPASRAPLGVTQWFWPASGPRLNMNRNISTRLFRSMTNGRDESVDVLVPSLPYRAYFPFACRSVRKTARGCSKVAIVDQSVWAALGRITPISEKLHSQNGPDALVVPWAVRLSAVLNSESQCGSPCGKQGQRHQAAWTKV